MSTFEHWFALPKDELPPIEADGAQSIPNEGDEVLRFVVEERNTRNELLVDPVRELHAQLVRKLFDERDRVVHVPTR